MTTPPLSHPDLSHLVLGIETSCDETAAAVVRYGALCDASAMPVDERGEILANVVRSQFEQHAPYGGVVPEIAARAHIDRVGPIVQAAMAEANAAAGVGWGDLTGIAATAGPGLIGGLVVGLTAAKGIAIATGQPLLAVNHLEAHALTVGLTDHLHPPYLLLLVSGGHTQLLAVEGVGRYRRLGTTLDDALGEAFDKTAKLLGLPQPGGPAVEALAVRGTPTRFALPRPMVGRPGCDFSFAGLKTAVRQAAQTEDAAGRLDEAAVADLCAAFQASVVAVVMDRVRRAVAMLPASARAHIVVAGGVAANAALRAGLQDLAQREDLTLHVPPAALCTDNGAMVAWAGAVRLARGLLDGLDAPARARWPLDHAAPRAIGAGAKA